MAYLVTPVGLYTFGNVTQKSCEVTLKRGHRMSGSELDIICGQIELWFLACFSEAEVFFDNDRSYCLYCTITGEIPTGENFMIERISEVLKGLNFWEVNYLKMRGTELGQR